MFSKSRQGGEGRYVGRGIGKTLGKGGKGEPNELGTRQEEEGETGKGTRMARGGELGRHGGQWGVCVKENPSL